MFLLCLCRPYVFWVGSHLVVGPSSFRCCVGGDGDGVGCALRVGGGGGVGEGVGEGVGGVGGGVGTGLLSLCPF